MSTTAAIKMANGANPYQVVWLPIDEIRPSPENDQIYGAIQHDEQMAALIDSIRRRQLLADPIRLTQDKYVMSGHRRLYAVRWLGWRKVPCFITKGEFRAGSTDYHKVLAEFNPQRIKTPGSLLREALLRDTGADTYAAIEERREAALNVDAEFMEVDGSKEITPISDRRMPFLKAVQDVIERLRSYWPLSIRQIHYQLLNKPPLKQLPQRSRFDREHYRYKNDDSSYNSLVDLLSSARYSGQVSMTCIDDPTRPQKTWGGFDSVSDFVQDEVDGFLTGYHRDRQQDQPRHIEVFAEKNTLFKIVSRACTEYYVPFSIGRGFCTIPVWRDIAKRFHQSGKERMTLIVISDYDPEGLELADDAIRSLELHKIPVDGHRIAVTREQIEELGLAEDFNPAKESSSRFQSFVDRTGDTKTWECEALPPDYLVEQIKAAIEANMDMEVFGQVCDEEERDCDRLAEVREQIASQLKF